MMLTPRTYLAKRKSRWPCDACVIHARFARDEIINLAARRFARKTGGHFVCACVNMGC